MKRIDELQEERKKALEEIKKLEESDVLKKYKELKKHEAILLEKIRKLYVEKKLKEYKNCNHVFITSDYEQKSKYSNGIDRMYSNLPVCIKCGLDAKNKFNFSTKYYEDDGIMKKYFLFHECEGKFIKRTCNLELARQIYFKLKEKNLAQDDDMLVKNFTIVFDNLNKDNNIDDAIKLLLKNK